MSRSRRFKDFAVASTLVVLVIGAPALALLDDYVVAGGFIPAVLLYIGVRAARGYGRRDGIASGLIVGLSGVLSQVSPTWMSFPSLSVLGGPTDDGVSTVRSLLEQLSLGAVDAHVVATVLAGALRGGTFGLHVSITMWFINGLGGGTPPAQPGRPQAQMFLLLSAMTGLAFTGINLLTKGISVLGLSSVSGLTTALFMYLSLHALSGAAREVGSLLRLGLVEMARAWPFLRALLLPATGFGTVYLVAVLEFASCYAVIFRLDPEGSFRAEGLIGAPRFGDFLFFALSTVTTLGYSPITPISPAAQILTAVQVVTGITLLTVGFAAVLAHLDRQFSMIAGRPGDKSAAEEEVDELHASVEALTKLMAAEHQAAETRHSELRADLESLREGRISVWTRLSHLIRRERP